MPIPIHGKQYLTVAERLDLAHADKRPVGIKSTATEYIPQPPDTTLCRATITFEDGRSFQGHAEVPVNSSNPAERDAPYECAETSAWGRALAAAGYPGNETGLAGAEEMVRPPRANRSASDPTARGFPPEEPFPEPIEEDTRRIGNGRAPEPAGTRPGASPATPPQLKTIERMARAQGKQIPTESLTRAQASEIISRLIGQLDARQAEPAR